MCNIRINYGSLYSAAAETSSLVMEFLFFLRVTTVYCKSGKAPKHYAS